VTGTTSGSTRQAVQIGDPNVRASIRLEAALSDEAVACLFAQAEGGGLRGWLLAQADGLDATIEGSASALARIVDEWSRWLRAEHGKPLLATFTPSDRPFGSLRLFRDRASLEQWFDASAKEPPPAGRAETSSKHGWRGFWSTVGDRISSVFGRGEPTAPRTAPVVSLREVLGRHRPAIARGLRIDERQLGALLEETSTLAREESDRRIAAFLAQHRSPLRSPARARRRADADDAPDTTSRATGARREPPAVRDGDVPALVPVDGRTDLDPCFIQSLFPAGPVQLWPEDTFPLFGTAIAPGELDRFEINADIYYLQERVRLDALLSELGLGQSLHRQWRQLYATAAHTPALGRGAVEGHPDIWGVAGVVDENLAWIEPAEMTLQSHYASQETAFTLTRTGSRAMRELGNVWPELPLWSPDRNDLFHRLLDLRIVLRDRRQRVQALRDAGSREARHALDPDIASDLPVAIGVGYNYEEPPVPQLSSLYFVRVNADRYPGARGTWSDFFQAEHAATVGELDRVLPIVEEVVWQVGYHYLRHRTLSVLRLLNEAHEALTFEQFQRAVNRYAAAEALLDDVIRNDIFGPGDARRVTVNFTDPDTGADTEIFLHRVLTISTVVAPPSEFSREAITGELFISGFASIFLSEEERRELFEKLARVIQTVVRPILDGDLLTRPLEDALHYLKDFVIPACLGELFLRRGEWDRRDYDRALEQFTKAGASVPADGRDSPANHFLWLRMARAYLRKGYAEYAAPDGSWAVAFDDFGHVLEDAYGPMGQIQVPTILVHDGIRKVNPLVLALRIEACIHRTNIAARVNPLGYPENYVPAVRFDWITKQALGAVQALDDAEQRYITFRVNAEDALQRFQQLSAAVQLAGLEIVVAQANVSREEASLTAAQGSLTATRNRLRNAREALDEFTYLARVRAVYTAFLSGLESLGSAIVGGLPALNNGLLNMLSNDAFLESQLRRQVDELEDAVVVAQQNVVVASRTVAAARSLERLARLKDVIAQDALFFEAEREFNYARWFALADEMRDIVRYRLRATLRLVYLAQQAFYFMTGIQVGIVVYDVNPRDTARNLAGRVPVQSYLMGQHIRDAVASLEGEWISFYSAPGSSYQGRENCQPGAGALVEDVRLDILYPLPFHNLRQNGGGRIDFELTLEDLDCRSEGSYLQLVEDVEVYGTFGNLGGQSISAQLTNSPFSVVRVRDTANRITAGVVPDWLPSGSLGFKAVIKSQPLATQEFRGSLLQNPSFHACAGPGSTPILSPFEYNGLSQRWSLEIKGSENPRLDFAQIVSLGVRFRFAQFRQGMAGSGLEALHAAHCATRTRGSVLLLALYENFFVPGQPPLAPEDRVVTRQLLIDDFPMEHRTDPTLLNLGCLFAPRAGAPAFDPVHFHLTIDQYTDVNGLPIEVAADTTPVPEGQIAVSAGGDPASQSPLNVFVDRDVTDGVITPWLRLLPLRAGVPVGATFRLRVNLNENPTFDLANLEAVIMHLEYRFG
jgi:hypothetical protein